MHSSLRLFRGEVDGFFLAQSPDDFLTNQLRIAQLQHAGISLIFGSVWPWFDLRPGRDAMDEALSGVDALRHFTATHSGFALAFDSAQARRLMSRNLIAVVPHLEGAESIHSVEDVDVLYAAGYRVVQLVHFTDNAIADAHDGQFGAIFGSLLNGEQGGLSELGKAAVCRMIALGMLIDLAHASTRTIDDVLAITEAAGVPVLSSHEGPDWKSPRTLDDERARRIAAGGGVIGVGIYRHDTLMSAPQDERWPGFVAKSCDDNLAIWSHYASAVGAANVVLGSDFNSVISRPRAGGQCPNGLRNAGDLPDYLGALTKRGIPLTALDHSADRVLRLLGAVEAKADPSVQQHARHLLRAAASAFTSPL